MNYDGCAISRIGYVFGALYVARWPVVGAVALFIGFKVTG